jgi:hypothetical protein
VCAHVALRGVAPCGAGLLALLLRHNVLRHSGQGVREVSRADFSGAARTGKPKRAARALFLSSPSSALETEVWK